MKWNPIILAIGLLMGLSIGLSLTPLAAIDKHVTVATWLEVVHRVCTSIGGLGTFVALLFVVRQFNLLHSQSELMQKNIMSSMDSQLYSRLDSFNKFIVEHYQEYELLDQPYDRNESADRRSKLHHLCDLGLTFYGEIYKHHVKYKLLDTEDWEEWQQQMTHFFSKAYVRGYWAAVADRYGTSFQRFANDLIARTQGP